ncbi:MAG: NAD-dependent epimerase/dehydratase family protein [candidate division KSB1 bacterium]|nr:NAD-dependent epimerase/dehydratase family protein [candidate division KSB1 bacterium]
MKRILVTGGAGFIGSHTTDLLIQQGYQVRILDNLQKPVHQKGKPDYLHPEAEFIEGDVRNKRDFSLALRQVDAVIHLAAYQDYLPDFSTFFEVNSVGTALLYEIIVEEKLPIQKVVVASSQAVYGEGRYRCDEHGIFYPAIRSRQQLLEGEWDHRCPKCGQVLVWQTTDESRVNPQNQYAISKYTQELISLNLGRRYGIPTTCMRYSIVQGPRQSFYNAYSGACRIFSLALFLGKAPVIFEDGKQVRDYVNIADVAAANVLVLERRQADFEVYNVGGGRAYTVYEFFECVREAFGVEVTPTIDGQFRFGDTRHIFSDISKLKGLGWSPQHDVKKSVADYLAYLRIQDGIADILDSANQKMRALNVIQQAQRKDFS